MENDYFPTQVIGVHVRTKKVKRNPSSQKICSFEQSLQYAFVRIKHIHDFK
jgi:ribosomal protein L24